MRDGNITLVKTQLVAGEVHTISYANTRTKPMQTEFPMVLPNRHSKGFKNTASTRDMGK